MISVSVVLPTFKEKDSIPPMLRALDALNLPDGKTKNFVAVLKALKLDNTKLLVSVPEYEENLLRASGNIYDVFTLKFDSVNTYHILDSDKILFTKDALDAFLKRLA